MHINRSHTHKKKKVSIYYIIFVMTKIYIFRIFFYAFSGIACTYWVSTRRIILLSLLLLYYWWHKPSPPWWLLYGKCRWHPMGKYKLKNITRDGVSSRIPVQTYLHRKQSIPAAVYIINISSGFKSVWRHDVPIYIYGLSRTFIVE